METTTFAELPLGQKLQAAIAAAGYINPTPIQVQAIPVAVTGQDVLGIAQTGTGKTAGFVLPMIQRLESGRARARMPRSLILAPTRELAAQVAQSFEKYGINHKLNVALLIGGVSMDDQVKKLDRGVDVLIATPGRLLDHFQRGRIMLMGVEILVIDEADRMLDMGFIPDIEKICKLLPPRRQTLFFSATMPSEIQRLVDQFLKDPVRIEVARPATTAKTITQKFRFCASTEDWEKRDILRQLIKSETVRNAIIFCNRKRDVAILHKSLVKHGFNAGALHGDMEQSARTETLDKFRAGEIMLLAASDVAARGLDIPDVSHVFNFDIPWAGDDYVHRIGRTGRAGKEGVSLSLVTPEDLKLLKDIEKVTGETPTWIGEAPTAEDFAEGGKRKRRGRSAGRGDERRPGRSSESRASGSRSSERRPRHDGPGAEGDAPLAPRPERTPRDRPRAEGDVERLDARPEQREAGRTEQRAERSPDAAPEGRRGRRPERRATPSIPGMGDQPVIGRGEGQPADQAPRAERAGDRERQPSGGQPRGPARDRPNRDRPAHGGSQRADQPQRSERVREPRGGDRPQREHRQAEPVGAGFADNVPAFLRRPVRPAKEPANE